ncbi:helix-turn-helix domain-containing protein [Burkholderia glumae]|uniref:helix-turn-helix domain-containing protein n=1 Tax=Burkholderia TaxID=32008 RepID=UPI001ABA0ED7|nr:MULTISPECIES: helix-turn-helix transcriptional regulator [Burkholderia]MCM2537734.1 helix-turn-helix domain-containing protein [Burkholderia glumae]
MKISSRYKEKVERARKSPEYWTEKALLGLVQQYYAAMKKDGFTQKALAEKLGKQPAFVSRVFSGRHNLTVATANLLASALEMHVELKLEPNARVDRKSSNSLTADSSVCAPADGVVVRSRKLMLIKGANESITADARGADQVKQAA